MVKIVLGFEGVIVVGKYPCMICGAKESRLVKILAPGMRTYEIGCGLYLCDECILRLRRLNLELEKAMREGVVDEFLKVFREVVRLILETEFGLRKRN